MSTSHRPLVVYFSRPGWNYDNGGRTHLGVGNTQVLAELLAELLGCATHRLEPTDPYPDSYDQTVERNVREQQRQARPGIANPLPSLAGHDIILLGSPIWNVQAPRIMRTFIDAHDFTGITIAPFTTHAMSGLGTVPEEYRQACRNTTRITEGLAIQGEQVHDARTPASTWLHRIGLLRDGTDSPNRSRHGPGWRPCHPSPTRPTRRAGP